MYTETREVKSPKKDKNLVQATVQKLLRTPAVNLIQNPTVAWDTIALLTFARGESSHCAALRCHQPQAGRQILTRKQKLTYQFSGTSHRNLFSQSTTVASPFAGSNPITLLPARSLPENSMPSMHCCKAQLPERTLTPFIKKKKTNKLF